MNFPGTITVSHGTLVSLVKDIGYSLDRQGIERFIIANGHGTNACPLYQAAFELQTEKPDMDISSVNVFSIAPDNFKYDFLSRKAGVHANDYE